MIDLDMLAEDMAKMLDRYSYEIDASADDIRPHLDTFIAAVQATVANRPAEPMSADAATWTPEPEVTPATTFQVPKLGRVRIIPMYVFAATDPNEPDRDEVWISDDDKQGEAWARQRAEEEFGHNGVTVGRLLRVEKQRIRPWAKR